MKLRVNGKDETLDAGMTVLDYLEKRNLVPQGVVVELNRAIIMNEDYGTTVLVDGDSLEVLKFVGGG